MEYPFKLSEIIAGCESGAWLEGAVFNSDEGDSLIFRKGEFIIKYELKVNCKWGFIKYVNYND